MPRDIHSGVAPYLSPGAQPFDSKIVPAMASTAQPFSAPDNMGAGFVSHSNVSSSPVYLRFISNI
jgi:hypothetical protein